MNNGISFEELEERLDSVDELPYTVDETAHSKILFDYNLESYRIDGGEEVFYVVRLFRECGKGYESMEDLEDALGDIDEKYDLTLKEMTTSMLVFNHIGNYIVEEPNEIIYINRMYNECEAALEEAFGGRDVLLEAIEYERKGLLSLSEVPTDRKGE